MQLNLPEWMCSSLIHMEYFEFLAIVLYKNSLDSMPMAVAVIMHLDLCGQRMIRKT